MQASNFGGRQLAERDHSRLSRLAAARTLPQLHALLDEADVLAADELPPDLVTLDAQVVLRDLKLQRRQVLVVCHPADADAARGHVSVLSPAGLGLIGLVAGAVARWEIPGCGEQAARIEAVTPAAQVQAVTLAAQAAQATPPP